MEGSGGTEQLREVLPGYEVSGLLGRGAMGEVLAGRHERLDRAVAIKRLPPAFAEDPEVRERFGQEARVLASLNHPTACPRTYCASQRTAVPLRAIAASSVPR